MKSKLSSLVFYLALASGASAQQAFNTSLYRQYTLSQLGASAGNDCWGYVSPSGREYAIVSLSNKIVFIEVTNPTNTVKFAEFPHTSSSWGDVKVYGSTAYAVTEASGTGIQVVDMSNIDAATNRVTLVRTLASPGRTHNLSLDPVSGYLYTCGSRDGTGTTMCFDIHTNPLNPVRVGLNSLTPTYQHDANTVTYTSGPNAGRQIMFGSGENRGVEIWDVTDKNNVFLVRRISYPFVGYCHQGWLSEDRKYYYVDDELDEAQQGISTTRTLVFDVSVLESADLVGTYTTGKPSIDHNLYWRNGFIFQSDYSSGLRIFNANIDPVNPPQVGWYDTFPADDRVDFVGAWSSYVFLPSGTVITSDINGGAFILDVSEATKTPFSVNTFNVERGRIVSGGLPELGTQDSQYFVVNKWITVNANEAPIRLVFEGTSLWKDISRLKFEFRHKVNSGGLEQTIELWDWTTSAWVQQTVASAPTTDTTFTLVGTSPDRFVDQTTKQMRARVQIRATGITSVADWGTSIDLARWVVNP
ncbi:MAG: choice-of-anchor B family protein [Chthonomonadaceae bacterium]|nr:choice-of-anchor B family protein [Chthonomonadaceae bacterium]